MYEQLNLLLEKYNSSGKMADKRFIYDALIMIFNYYEINDFINQAVDIERYNGDFLARYYYVSGLLQFNAKLIYTECNNMVLHNAIVLQIILHECHHINKYKHCEQDSSLNGDFARLIMGRNFLLKKIGRCLDGMNSDYTKEELEMYVKYMNGDRGLYNKLGFVHPAERMAEIDSYNDLLKVVENNKELYSEIEKILYKKNRIGYQVNGEIVKAPLISFMDDITQLHYDKDMCLSLAEELMKKSKGMSLQKRMYYGLPITVNEYNNC